MRNTIVYTLHGAGPGRALVARGRALRTFGGLALLLTVGLFVMGAYLIKDEFSNPLASQSFSLFAAAFVLATAMTLLYELAQLPRSLWRHGAQSATGGARPASDRINYAARRLDSGRVRREHRTDLPYQRCYVDRVRVRA